MGGKSGCLNQLICLKRLEETNKSKEKWVEKAQRAKKDEKEPKGEKEAAGWKLTSFNPPTPPHHHPRLFNHPVPLIKPPATHYFPLFYHPPPIETVISQALSIDSLYFSFIFSLRLYEFQWNEGNDNSTKRGAGLIASSWKRHASSVAIFPLFQFPYLISLSAGHFLANGQVRI